MSGNIYIQVSLTYEQYMAMAVALLDVERSDNPDAEHAREAHRIIASQARVVSRKGAK